MSTHTQVRQAVAGRLRSAWQRWQGRVSRLYFLRVTQPIELWLACGRWAAVRPHLPWWHRFVWAYLSVTGWARHFPRLPRRRV